MIGKKCLNLGFSGSSGLDSDDELVGFISYCLLNHDNRSFVPNGINL